MAENEGCDCGTWYALQVTPGSYELFLIDDEGGIIHHPFECSWCQCGHVPIYAPMTAEMTAALSAVAETPAQLPRLEAREAADLASVFGRAAEVLAEVDMRRTAIVEAYGLIANPTPLWIDGKPVHYYKLVGDKMIPVVEEE
jgi:hypothetical protein